MMTLKLVKTKHTAFIVDEVSDELRENMGILFGRELRLYARRVKTTSNPKGVMEYSNYFSNQAVQVCQKENIIEERPVNEKENKIFQELSVGQSIDAEDREYLRSKYFEG